MNKLIDTAVVICIIVIVTALGSAAGGSTHGKGEFLTLFTNTMIAMAILGGMSLAGYAIAMIPGLNKLPVIFWVSIVAAVLCSPLCGSILGAVLGPPSGEPYEKVIYKLTEPASIVVISTVVLACAGLALGKDINQFKTISWRIIPVSLAVFSGTFIFAALIAQVTLHWTGTI